MLNGDGLIGHHSSTQAAMIVPKPGNRNIYYVFTVDLPSYDSTDEDDTIEGVNFTEVDMSLDGGLGGVTSVKNQHLITYDTNDSKQSEFKSSEKITAIQHNDGSSFWVITHFVNKFYVFKVTSSGVNTTPVISTTSQTINPILNELGFNETARGYLKVSPDGSKLAIAHSSTSAGGPRSGTRKNGRLNLYDFDSTTGIVSNLLTLITNEFPYGVEFSAKSTKLYATSSLFDVNDDLISTNLYQFDLTANNIQTSKQIIQSSTSLASALQLAIDGKIYRAGFPTGSSVTSLSVINKPNESGTNCNYDEYSIETNQKVNLGLPPFIQSFFLFTFNFEFLCYGDNTHFYITSQEPYDAVLWDFGDGITSTLADPYHTYANAGEYEVVLTKYIGGDVIDIITKAVTIFNIPNVPTTIYDLVQCDAQDNDQNDGLSTFNLDLANDFVSNENINDIDVYYYTDQSVAENDIDNIDALNPIYNNISPNEILFAKVLKKGSDCYAISRIRLIANSPIDLSMANYFSCDLGDNTAVFDLDIQQQLLISSLGLPANATISFHNNQIDAALAENSLDDSITSEERTIYIRGEVDGICLGVGSLDLKIHSFPTFIEYEEIENCFNSFPLQLNTGATIFNSANFSFDWGNGNNSSEFEVQNAGEYEVTITDIITLCSKTRTIKVIEIFEPEIIDVSIDEVTLGFNVVVEMSRDDGYLFALDNVGGSYQDTNTFYQVLPGNHVIYVTNSYGCIIIEKDIFILGYPKFFTPNDDAVNDKWQIVGYDLSNFTASQISIFNRFGKLITQIDPLSDGWDGYYNGEKATATDYWFSVQITDLDGKVIDKKGHFSLVRR